MFQNNTDINLKTLKQLMSDIAKKKETSHPNAWCFTQWTSIFDINNKSIYVKTWFSKTTYAYGTWS